MSREHSPPPLSDDSAVGSLTSSATNNARSQTSHGDGSQQSRTDHDSDTNKTRHQNLIRPDQLRLMASRMRYNNTSLTSSSIRTNLSCFNDLDIQRFESSPEYIVNFISLGINKSQHCIHRPVSILWPDTYDKMVDGLSKLDAYLINSELKEKPIDWLISRGLTSVPNCRQCKERMTLRFERDNVKWNCQKTPACLNSYALVQRPSTFKGYENISLLKLLFSMYYWACCTTCDLLYGILRLEPEVMHGIWRRLQNVCRVALEKSYPRFRLCNRPNSDGDSNITLMTSEQLEPIDLVSIKLNGNYIVCAKHPKSNCVRLGLWVPGYSQYSVAMLTTS